MRNEGGATAFHRGDVERVGGRSDFGQGAVENVNAATYFHGEEQELAPLHLPPLAGPGANNEVIDFGGGEHLGIDHTIDADGVEKILVVVGGVLGVVDARYTLAGSELLGQHAAGDVAALVGRDADEEVGAFDVGFLKLGDRTGRTTEREQIDARGNAVEALLLFVDEGYVVTVLEKEFG